MFQYLKTKIPPLLIVSFFILTIFHLKNLLGHFSFVHQDYISTLFMTIFNPAFLWLACGSASHLQDYKCSYISKYNMTLFPDHNQYDTNSNWKAIADKRGFEISRDCEIWHK